MVWVIKKSYILQHNFIIDSCEGEERKPLLYNKLPTCKLILLQRKTRWISFVKTWLKGTNVKAMKTTNKKIKNYSIFPPKGFFFANRIKWSYRLQCLLFCLIYSSFSICSLTNDINFVFMLHFFLFIYLVKHIMYFYIKNICCAADDNVYIVLCKEIGVTSLV